MRKAALLLPLVCCALVAASIASGSAQDEVELPTDVPMAGGDFEGAPPPFEVPDGGSVEVIELINVERPIDRPVGDDPLEGGEGGTEFVLRRADGSRFATAVVGPDERTVAAHWYDAEGELQSSSFATYPADEVEEFSRRMDGGARRPKGKGRRAATCGVNSWAEYAGRWTSPFVWHFVSGSTPGYLSVDTTETMLRNAYREWYINDNYCGIPDQSEISIGYGGRFQTSFGQNGRSSVGFGNPTQLGCASSAVACTQIWGGSGRITESDTRISTNVTWINGLASDKYDVWHVQAHEIGHALGFDHVYNYRDNVMFYQVYKNDTTHRRLGRGDANGNNAKY